VFPAENYTAKWLEKQAKALGGCHPGILERCVQAMKLLGLLAATGLPFVFKGGTSLLLHLKNIRRLSIDVDIVCGEKAEVVNEVLSQIGRPPHFLRWETDERDHRDLPNRRHFKFYFHSVFGQNLELPILLDVVEEGRSHHQLTRLPVQTVFLIPEREILVHLPTIESLLGDKLTAFAPKTIGVPLRNSDGQPGELMQVAKQLFDVGSLFDVVQNFDEVAQTYAKTHALENEYRGGLHTLDAALKDTFDASLALTAMNTRVVDKFPDAPLLYRGFQNMRGHYVGQSLQLEDVRRLAGRAGLLAASIRTNSPFDFKTGRYTAANDQIAAVKLASFNRTPFDWLDGVKSVNPEAYFYLHRAIHLSKL
jgi:hypothetical protein